MSENKQINFDIEEPAAHQEQTKLIPSETNYNNDQSVTSFLSGDLFGFAVCAILIFVILFFALG
tara:strand:+ start:469 stop:660 length:192 start_codon:yes stop_codon:yes gene_type:complete